jgi:transposase
MAMVIDITTPDAAERFDNRSATFSVISVSPSFRLADRWFPHLDAPLSPLLSPVETLFKKTKTIIKRYLRKKQSTTVVAQTAQGGRLIDDRLGGVLRGS